MLATDIKVVFLGESTVGKTSIISCFAQGEFNQEQTSTIGACFTMKKIILDDKTEIKLKIWDTAGQERFRALTPMYYRDADVAILVFAVDDKDSFEKLQRWIDDLSRDIKIMPPLIIVGNKIDLFEQRKISSDDAEKFAESVSATFLECSAKSKEGIEEIFTTAGELASKITHKSNAETSKLAQEIIDGDNDQENKQKKCC